MTRTLLLSAGKVSLIGLAAFLLSAPAARAQGTTAGRSTGGGVGTGGGAAGGGAGAAGATGTTGTTGFQATGPQSQIATTNQGGRGATNQMTGPTLSNPFQTTYAYPQQAGMTATGAGSTAGGRGVGGAAGGRGASTGAFGATLYYVTATTTTGSQTTATASTMKVPSNYNSFGLKRDLPYTTVMGPSIGGPSAQYRPNNSQLRGSLQNVVAQSQRMSANRAVRVALDGNTVVLQGYVDTPRDSRVAEGLMRVTPGVRDVRNELQVKNPTAP